MPNRRSYARWLLGVSLVVLTGPGMSAQQIYSMSPYDALHGYNSGLMGWTTSFWTPTREPASLKEPLVSADYLRHPLSRKAQRFLHKIDSVIKQGRHREAIAQLRAGLPQFRKDAPYFYNLIGVESVEVQDFATAKDVFGRVLEAMPHLSLNNSNYGMSLVALGEIDAGVRYLRTAVALDEGNENAKAILEIMEDTRAHGPNGAPVKFVPHIASKDVTAAPK